MGILNATPDSFSDGGQFASVEAATSHAETMARDGVDIIDVGGESTRPGSRPPPLQQEIDRVVPVIESIVARVDVPVSIDTSRPDVMRAAIAAGASLINDVRALREPGALDAAARLDVPVCLMHMQGQPADMQQDPRYTDVVDEVVAFLGARLDDCERAGIARERVLLDPGFGFGKTLEHNVALMRGLGRLTERAPVLVGVSRKGMIGALLGDPSLDRTSGSVAAALMAVARGAVLVRVHDVAQTVQALSVWQGLQDPVSDITG